MTKNGALLIAGIVFGLVALMHLIRLILEVDIIVGHTPIQMWVSVVAFIISFILCILMFKAMRKQG